VTVYREHVSCLACGKRVSGVDPELGLVVRAWVECPECLEAADRGPGLGGRAPDALRRQIVALTAERDKWLDAFNRSEQFQTGPTTRAEAAEAERDQLKAELAEQRAELTGTLSDLFKSIPECYDTPADHYREMARRLVEDRDVQKHKARAAEAERDHWKNEADALRIVILADGQPTADYIASLEAELDRLKAKQAGVDEVQPGLYVSRTSHSIFDNTTSTEVESLRAQNADLKATLRAAEPFLAVDVDRGPAIDGWADTVAAVARALAAPEAPVT